MKRAGWCLNWRVMAGLAAAGIGVWVFAPRVVSSALPFLILAVCPISMLLMMRAMQGGQGSTRDGTSDGKGSDLAELKARLVRVQAEQDAIAGEIACVEAEAVATEAERALTVDEDEGPDGRTSPAFDA